jgi:hypothetical protein
LAVSCWSSTKRPRAGAPDIRQSREGAGQGGFSDLVRAILLKSIHNNRMAASRGFLVAGEGRFLQVLEGPAAEVEATFQRIQRDPRHGDLVM